MIPKYWLLTYNSKVNLTVQELEGHECYIRTDPTSASGNHFLSYFNVSFMYHMVQHVAS